MNQSSSPPNSGPAREIFSCYCGLLRRMGRKLEWFLIGLMVMTLSMLIGYLSVQEAIGLAIVNCGEREPKISYITSHPAN